MLTDMVRHYYEADDPSGIHFAGKSDVLIPTALWDRIMARWRTEGVMPSHVILQAVAGEDVSDAPATLSAAVATESPSSADYDKGLAAYESGDYATALRVLTPFAEQGDANAQDILGVMYQYGEGVPQDL